MGSTREVTNKEQKMGRILSYIGGGQGQVVPEIWGAGPNQKQNWGWSEDYKLKRGISCLTGKQRKFGSRYWEDVRNKLKRSKQVLKTTKVLQEQHCKPRESV
ncbi:hypothetical protein DSO57_1016732 [Entomophthora muscae]|uniref:Uncharacterized protein n=1 Tax=Entomophthora muscae TaxID=34485 RepID=A0ACC2RW59_9FUNG|nr:hypothetical protein DSO57_1016732 [Entomophthora muscae]